VAGGEPRAAASALERSVPRHHLRLVVYVGAAALDAEARAVAVDDAAFLGGVEYLSGERGARGHRLDPVYGLRKRQLLVFEVCEKLHAEFDRLRARRRLGHSRHHVIDPLNFHTVGPGRRDEGRAVGREAHRPHGQSVEARKTVIEWDAGVRMDVLDVAARAADTGPVCDACLGRLVAERSFGLSNAERGSALRTALALRDDEDYEPVETADCWVCEGRCGEFDAWAERATDAVGDAEFETYNVGTRTPPLIEENEALLREEAGVDADAGEPFKSEYNREVGKRVGRLTDTEVSFDRPDVQFTIDLAEDAVDAKVNSAFVYGRYRKLERDIPQTEWPCRECNGSGRQGADPCDHCGGSGYLYDDSVEEYTAPVVEDVMDGTDATFHGAGREDVDALMLGTGRPFVIEVAEPRRRRVETDRLQSDINAFADGAVEVEGLTLATYDMVERVKEHDASKRYRAEVAFDADVDGDALADAVDRLEGTTVEQYTPNRVDHRRAGLTRERDVYGASAEPDDARHATVEIHGAGGLYIKELISGDEGRTEPSLAGILGVGAEVTALDVVAVEGETEPFEDEAFFRE